ncbi:hypothetical protein [Croceicoccus mobilis]|uniref:hypothetical protein n=1 Tax=Croceicoccus mobilis TaxID=1703339 RepID=UPI0027E4008A|nr:hypothetical protein [Croceicoccus mobilis]
MPFKEEVISLLDHIHASAKMIEGVHASVIDDGADRPQRRFHRGAQPVKGK